LKLRKACKVVLKHFERECEESQVLGYAWPVLTRDWVTARGQKQRTKYKWSLFRKGAFLGDFFSRREVYEYIDTFPQARSEYSIVDYDLARELNMV
jgi:hypothetical protein